jgi:hypothetical protein
VAECTLPGPKPKARLFPILVALFIISYGLLTLLVTEQARTIDAQRSLINQIFGDSIQLTAMKGKEIQRQRAAAQAHAHANANSQAQTSSSQEAPQAGAKNRANSGKLRKPKGVADTPDARRALSTI